MVSFFLLFVLFKGGYEATVTHENIVYSIENGEATILGQEEGSNLLKDLVFPEYITYENEQYPVTTIANEAFSNSENISGTLTLCSTLKAIGSNAFYECEGITGHLIIPDSVTSLGVYCFSGTSITLVTLSQNLTVIPEGIFCSCYQLSKIPILPPKIQEIGPYAFALCNKMKGELNLPSNLTTIGSFSFYGCYSMKGHLSIPDSVVSMGEDSFHSTGITSLTLSQSLTRIEKQLFALSCLSGIIDFPENIEYIGESAFYQTNISEVKFTNNIKEFGAHTFYGTKINSITFPSYITIIPALFLTSSALTGKLSIPSQVVEIQQLAFAFTSITSIELNSAIGLKIIDEAAFYADIFLSGVFPLGNFSLIGPLAFFGCSFDSVQVICTHICESAFCFNSKLSGKVEIMTSFIDQNAFSFCPNIKSLEIAFINTYNGSILVPHQNYLPKMFVFSDSSLLNFNITTESDFVSYGDLAFGFCSSLKLVNFPATIESICNRCFYCCSSLPQNLILTDYTSLRIIGNESFYGCESIIGEVAFPNSLEIIGDRAFSSLHISGSIHIPDNVVSIGTQSFFGCQELTGSIYIGDNCKHIGKSAFSSCNNLCGSLYIGKNIRNISAYAFYGCCNLSGSLTVPEGVEFIDEYSFMGCSGFTGLLLLPQTLRSIGQYAFASCMGLSGIFEIPSSVTSISNSAFFGCSGFSEIHFLSSHVNVGPFSFSRLSNLCYENVPESFYINDPEIYSSTSKFKMQILSGELFNLKFHCSTFHTLDTIVYALTVIGSSGAFVAVFTFSFNTLQLFYRNVRQLQTIFDAIISKQKAQNENEQQSIENITNDINNYLLIDSKEKEDFTFTARQANKALKKSIESQWPNLHIASKKYIINHSFNDIPYRESFSFHSCFSRCHCGCKKHEEYSDAEENISHKSLALQELI